MFGREYRFTTEVPGWGEREVVYTMTPLERSDGGARVDWKIPSLEPMGQEDIIDLDTAISEMAYNHWKENSGDYQSPGPQGGEVP